MMAGGIVVDGRTLALSDIACPVLTVIGLRDEIALPAALLDTMAGMAFAEVVAYAIILAVLVTYYFMSARRVSALQRDVQLLEDETKRRQGPAGGAGAE